MWKPLLLTYLLVSLLWLSTQAQSDQLITVHFDQMELTEVIEELRMVCDCPIYLAPKGKSIGPISGSFENTPVSKVLNEILRGSTYSFLWHQQQVFVIGDSEILAQRYSAQFYEALEESLEAARNPEELVEVIGSPDAVEATGETLLSGSIRDGETNEPIIGATILVKEDEVGTATDESGEFEIKLRPGTYILAVQFIGYRDREIPINLISSGSIDLTMLKGSILLDEVVVQAQKRDENVQSAQVGVTRITTREIERLPSFLGEVDIIKSLLLQPGVSSIGEGSSGFNVRGGNVDQNLILIDEAMLFNSSHALGFFSSFNSDIVADATLYKANIPARYGGRLSSVLNVNLREGDFEKLRFKGGLGLVSSRFTLEGPLKKNQTSILLSGRSTYSDWLLQSINLPELKRSSAFFYDANLRITHRFNERNFLSLSAYRSDDQFTYNEEFGFDYRTNIAQLAYQSLITDRWLSTFSVIFSDYESNQDELRPLFASRLSIRNQYWKLKENINYSGGSFSADIGVSTILYTVNPGELQAVGIESTIIPGEVDKEKGVESALYATVSYDLTPRLTLNGGLRYALYQYLGPRDRFIYQDPARPREEEIIERITDSRKTIYQKGILEPRISGRYRLTSESSLKFGYARTSQFINLISNNDTPTPTNVWQLSNDYVEPQLAHNFSLGYFRNFAQNIWITSLDVFYRHIDRLFDYKDFADLIVNPNIETELRRGIGRTRGVELSIKKQIGEIHGWINYTYSRSERKVSEINEGNWYPANFDKPHDLSIVTNFQLNKRNTISINFNYSTGRPITAPVDRYLLENQFAVLNYSLRSAFRIPDYHRLDVAYTLGQGFRKSKKFKTSWTFSIYNLYARRNAFSVFIDQVSTGRPRVRRLSVLGSAFPSLTFNFELL